MQPSMCFIPPSFKTHQFRNWNQNLENIFCNKNTFSCTCSCLSWQSCYHLAKIKIKNKIEQQQKWTYKPKCKTKTKEYIPACAGTGLGVGSEGAAGEKNMHDAEFTCALFRFIQLTCEGHNLGKQANIHP